MATPALWANGSPIDFTAPQRHVDSVWLHCSASDQASHDDMSVMRDWHLARGWDDVGYHLFIQKSGSIQAGRSLERTPSAQAGYNTGAIAICLHGLKEENFTVAQYASVIALCTAIRAAYSRPIRFRGHQEVSSKACPVFDYRQVLGLTDDGYMGGPTTTAPHPADPPPTSGPGSTQPAGALQLTSRGPAVEVLQNLLIVNGVSCEPDGAFGQETAAAVRAFQSKAGLAVTGVADQAVQQSLAEGVAETRTLATGHAGSDVAAFQRILVLHQIRVACDGAFGPLTKAAVESFQRKHGVAVSGTVDAITRAASWR